MKQPRIFSFGPGTRAMILGIAVFGVYGAMTQPPAPPLPKATASAPPPPLWKPEPQMLLDRADLDLTAAQRAKLISARGAWDARKKELLAQIVPLADGLRSGGRTSMSDLQANAEGYAALSRAYDAERDAHWTGALRVLDPIQRAKVEKMKEGER